MKKTPPYILAFCISMFGCNHAQKPVLITTPHNKNVPWVVIETKQEIEDDPKTTGTITISRNDSILVSSPIGIELRGALSLTVDKKSYGFELRDSTGKSKHLSLLGMPKEEDWILYGPMLDPAMVRNPLAYSIANQLGRYAARSEFVELQVNGDFKGLYLLMEKLKKGSDRINIQNKDTTGSMACSYILKIDKTSGNGQGIDNYTDENSFRSNFDQNALLNKNSVIHYLYEYPKAKDLDPAQKAYIQQYIADFEKGLTSPKPEEVAKTIEQYIDLSSFVDYFILTEWMQNNDGYRISTYLQKDKTGKLAMGPIWDCDLAFGPEQSFCGPMGKDNWVYRYNQFCGSDTWLVPFWWLKLTQTPVFKNAVVARWKALRQTVLSDKNIDATLTHLVGSIQQTKMIDRNYERWSESKKDKDYQKRNQRHIDRIKAWSVKHSAWIDLHISEL